MKPKPGGSYETGADRAGCWPSGPGETPQGPTGRTAGPGGLWTRRGVPAGDYMPRAALVVTHFFLGENRHAPKIDLFFGFIVTRQTAMPIQLCRDSVQGGMFDSKSYFTVAKILRAGTS